MYEYILLGLAIFVVLYGILIVACPKAIVKKENKDNEDYLKTKRKQGICVLIAGIGMLLLEIYFIFIM